MHFTPYHKKKSWQRFFFGLFSGALLAYCILIFMYGSMYEKLLKQNYELQSELTELKSQNEALLEDNESIDEERKKKLTVERIEITISNAEKLKIDQLSIPQLDEMIKQEIKHIIGKDINTVSDSDQLLQSTIENKVFSIDDFSYYFEVKKLVISQTVKLVLIAKLSN